MKYCKILIKIFDSVVTWFYFAIIYKKGYLYELSIRLKKIKLQKRSTFN